MSQNFQIGDSETQQECWLKFHQYLIYNTDFKNNPGYICIGTDGNFYVEPFASPIQNIKISELKDKVPKTSKRF